MTEMTIQVRDSLAPQIQSFGGWFSTIIELAAANFKTSAPQKASAELIDFLSQNPAPPEVLDYSLSNDAQERVSLLLDLNREGEATEDDQNELDEWMKFEHICILLTAKAAKEKRAKL